MDVPHSQFTSIFGFVDRLENNQLDTRPSAAALQHKRDALKRQNARRALEHAVGDKVPDLLSSPALHIQTSSARRAADILQPPRYCETLPFRKQSDL